MILCCREFWSFGYELINHFFFWSIITCLRGVRTQFYYSISWQQKNLFFSGISSPVCIHGEGIERVVGRRLIWDHLILSVEEDQMTCFLIHLLLWLVVSPFFSFTVVRENVVRRKGFMGTVFTYMGQ